MVLWRATRSFRTDTQNRYPFHDRTSLVAQIVKHLPTMQETRVRSLGWEDPLEKDMATHSSILAWRIPWTEETGRLLSVGSQRVRHDWAADTLILGWPCSTRLSRHPGPHDLSSLLSLGHRSCWHWPRNLRPRSWFGNNQGKQGRRKSFFPWRSKFKNLHLLHHISQKLTTKTSSLRKIGESVHFKSGWLYLEKNSIIMEDGGFFLYLNV